MYMKKIVKTIIKNKDEIRNYESKAIMTNNKLKYKEDDTTVVLEIKTPNLVLKRENKECSYTFHFSNKKSFLEFNLNTNNYRFKLDFETKKITISKNIIEVIYILEDIEYNYTVNIEEDL